MLARGVANLAFGYNAGIGGSTDTPGARWFPLVNLTIEIDGVEVMRDGQLAADLTAWRRD